MMLVLIDDSSHNLAMTKAAEEAFGIHSVSDFYYIDQIEKDERMPENFQLTSPKNPQFVQELGRKVLDGETDFDITVKDTTYTVLVEDIPEVNFKLIGLVKK